MARAGIASRRKAELMILEGRVSVNGKTTTVLGTKVDPERDKIEVDGRSVSGRGPRIKTYILLNKPRGYISAVSDPKGRPVVTDLVKRVKARVFPVGRLDYDSEGVLLLTDDGELTTKLIHPRHSVPKKYLVKVKNVPDEKDLLRLARGIRLEDGRTRPAKTRFVRETRENSWIEIIVTEGRNRLIKRMCQAVGHPVAKLRRLEFAGIKLGRLKTGETRRLTPKEVERLKGFARDGR